MRRIVPIIEGDGEVQAVPKLLSRLLKHKGLSGSWYIGNTIRVGSISKLKKDLRRFLELATLERDCGAIVILLDLDDGCPRTESIALATEITKLNLPQPVAIILAHREYETWFLASIDTIAGNHDLLANLTYHGDVERRRGAKEWLSSHMNQVPKPRRYRETFHQLEFTKLIDFDLAQQRSRSFRRLCHAIDELVVLADHEKAGFVTPKA